MTTGLLAASFHGRPVTSNSGKEPNTIFGKKEKKTLNKT